MKNFLRFNKSHSITSNSNGTTNDLLKKTIQEAEENKIFYDDALVEFKKRNSAFIEKFGEFHDKIYLALQQLDKNDKLKVKLGNNIIPVMKELRSELKKEFEELKKQDSKSDETRIAEFKIPILIISNISSFIRGETGETLTDIYSKDRENIKGLIDKAIKFYGNSDILDDAAKEEFNNIYRNALKTNKNRKFNNSLTGRMGEINVMVKEMETFLKHVAEHKNVGSIEIK